MALGGTVKGITIEFNGDTTKLGKAFTEINNKAKGVDQALQEVRRALKFNPGNTELLAQKQTLLKQKIAQTKEQLNALKAAQKTLDDDPAVDKTSQEYMKLKREIIEAESKLNHFNAELQKAKYAKIIQTGEAFKTAGQKMRTAGTYMTMAGGAMVLAGKKLLDLSSVQAQAETKLTEIYKTRMGATNKAAKATMNLASAIQKEGIIGDEITLSGAQQLATFAKYPNTVNKILPAMGNLLVQQKGYSATADDAKNVANMLGKALMGQTGALSRAGITFSDAEAKVLKYGTEEEKAAMLAKVVTKNVGNMNKEFAKTDEGKLAQAKNALGDVGERLGAVLLPALAKVAKWFSDNIMPKIESLISFIEAHPIIGKAATAIAGFLVVAGPITALLGAITSGIGILMTSITKIISVIGMVGKAMSFLIANPWVAIIMAIAVAALLIYKNWDKVKAYLIQIWNTISSVAKAIWEPIKKFFVGIWTGIKDAAITAWNGIKTFFSTIWNGIKAVATVIWNGIKAYFVGWFNIIKTVAMVAWKAIKTFLSVTWNGIKKVASTVWNGIKKAVLTPINALKSALSKAWSGIKSKASSVWNSIKSTASSVWNGVKKAITSPITAAKNAVKKIVSKIKGFFNFDFKLPKIKLPHFSIDPPGWSIGDLLDGEIPSLGIDWYAKGGIFKKPSVIGVGEAGAEAVLPIDRLETMLASMADSIVNGMATAMALQASGTDGEQTINITNYLYPNGAKMGEETVKIYDKYKKILG